MSQRILIVDDEPNIVISLEYLLKKEGFTVHVATDGEAALAMAAGALCERLWQNYAGGHIADSAEIARRIYPLMQHDLLG